MKLARISQREAERPALVHAHGRLPSLDGVVGDEMHLRITGLGEQPACDLTL